MYLGNRVLAWQRVGINNYQRVVWEHRDPSEASYRVSDETQASGGVFNEELPAELDPSGINTGLEDPSVTPPPNPPNESLLGYPGNGNPGQPDVKFTYNGVPMSRNEVMDLSGKSGAEVDRNTLPEAAASVGLLPLYGRFRVCVGNDCGPWEIVITGYSSEGSLATTLNFQSMAPQNNDVRFAHAPSPQNGPAHTPDACGDMADNAQNLANEELFDNRDPKSALKAFDSKFTRMYAGRAATSAIAAGRQFLNRGAGATVNRYYQGETGFRPEFRDTGSHAAGEFVDQTHHIAFYLSMGVNENGSGALWAAQRLHRARDNQGDANLGKAGYEMGTGLRDNPGGLRNIGDLIRKTICDPNRNPAHN